MTGGTTTSTAAGSAICVSLAIDAWLSRRFSKQIENSDRIYYSLFYFGLPLFDGGSNFTASAVRTPGGADGELPCASLHVIFAERSRVSPRRG
jgi:hypothetical protein